MGTNLKGKGGLSKGRPSCCHGPALPSPGHLAVVLECGDVSSGLASVLEEKGSTSLKAFPGPCVLLAVMGASKSLFTFHICAYPAQSAWGLVTITAVGQDPSGGGQCFNLQYQWLSSQWPALSVSLG